MRSLEVILWPTHLPCLPFDVVDPFLLAWDDVWALASVTVSGWLPHGLLSVYNQPELNSTGMLYRCWDRLHGTGVKLGLLLGCSTKWIPITAEGRYDHRSVFLIVPGRGCYAVKQELPIPLTDCHATRKSKVCPVQGFCACELNTRDRLRAVLGLSSINEWQRVSQLLRTVADGRSATCVVTVQSTGQRGADVCCVVGLVSCIHC